MPLRGLQSVRSCITMVNVGIKIEQIKVAWSIWRSCTGKDFKEFHGDA